MTQPVEFFNRLLVRRIADCSLSADAIAANRQIIHIAKLAQPAARKCYLAAGFSILGAPVLQIPASRDGGRFSFPHDVLAWGLPELWGQGFEGGRCYPDGGNRMAHSAEAAAREAKIAELKRLITAGTYETLEKLEEAVDAFLWSEHDRSQTEQNHVGRNLAHSHPK